MQTEESIDFAWHHFLSIELYSFSSFHKIKVNTKSKNNINYHYPDNFSMLETEVVIAE